MKTDWSVVVKSEWRDLQKYNKFINNLPGIYISIHACWFFMSAVVGAVYQARLNSLVRSCFPISHIPWSPQTPKQQNERHLWLSLEQYPSEIEYESCFDDRPSFSQQRSLRNVFLKATTNGTTSYPHRILHRHTFFRRTELRPIFVLDSSLLQVRLQCSLSDFVRFFLFRSYTSHDRCPLISSHKVK